MATPNSSTDIARETFKTLAARRVAPTPDNYARVYQEISGGPLPNDDALAPALEWSDLIHDLLRQLDIPHKGITLTRKKEGVETVLKNFSANPEELFEKLRALIRSWSTAQPQTNLGEIVSTESTTPGTEVEMVAQLRDLLAQSLESHISLQPELDRDLADEIAALTRQVKDIRELVQVARLSRMLRQFWIKLEIRGNDKARIKEGLLRLLRLLVQNLGDLTEDDKWLHGQINTLQEILSQPIDKRAIADAERNLRDTIIKQHMLKQDLTDAKHTLKNLMTSFIDRLGELAISTGNYHDRMEAYTRKISNTDNLADLGHILNDIMLDTRNIQASTLRSHEELTLTRKQAQEAEERVKQLERELELVSEKVMEDQLTGALNRRGMDDALEREINRSDRQNTSICLALLDIDNFKQLNDTLGHQAGDQALVHLAQVIKDTLRPTDAVARYGGEEFLIIMPDTDLEDAMATIARLQRELTRKFFLHNNERLLITFSAGVALRQSPSESANEVINRADHAMYQAKRSGKNRVISAT